MTTGERIRAARKRAGLTQMQISKRLGNASNSTVNQWERGTRTPSSKAIVRLAEAIGCTPEELLYDAENLPRDVERMREIVERERLEWKTKLFEKLRANEFDSARDKLAVLQGVEFLAEALDLMEGNMQGRFALAELIADAEAAYSLTQKGDEHNAGL